MKYDERRKLLQDIAHACTGDDHSVTIELTDAPELYDDATQQEFVPEAASLLYAREYDPVAGAWGYLTRVEFFQAVGSDPGAMVRRCVFTSADRQRLTPPWVIALLWEYCPSWYNPEPPEQGMPLPNSRPRRLTLVVPLRPGVPLSRPLCQDTRYTGTAMGVCSRDRAHRGIHRDTEQDLEWW